MIELYVSGSKYYLDETITVDSKIYQYNENLGKGGNSSVEGFIEKKSGIEYACKIIPLENYNDSVKRESKRSIIELKLLRKLNHSHVIEYYGYEVLTIKKNFKGKQKDVEALIIVMEKADCSLKEYICRRKVNYIEYSAQLVGLANALIHLHELAIYRDLKPENILVVNSKWVISDFGLAYMNDGSNEEITLKSKAIGPRFWLSPESFSRYINIDEHRKDISFNSDIYQMCSIFWFVVNRKHPSGMLSLSDFIGPNKLFEPIIKGLQHDASRRYISTAEFAQTLEECIYEV